MDHDMPIGPLPVEIEEITPDVLNAALAHRFQNPGIRAIRIDEAHHGFSTVLRVHLDADPAAHGAGLPRSVIYKGQFEEATKVRDLRPSDKGLALGGRSAAALRRANLVTGRAERRVALNDAEEYAKAMLALDRERPAAWVALGMALEDRAMLLGETAKYDDAVEKFAEALRLGDNRPDLALHLGRCQYRWGEATRQMARLADAKRNLDKAVEDDAVAAEANYFLAKTLVAQRSLLKDPAQAADACRAAEAAYRKAAAAAQSAPQWRELILADWGWLDTDEAYVRVSAMRSPSEKRLAYKNDAEVSRLLEEANRLADELKPLNAARAAYIRGRAARWRMEPDEAAAFERALTAFDEGLASNRPEDRGVQLDIRMLRAGIYQAQGKQEARLDDLREAEKLAKELDRPAYFRAELAERTARQLELMAENGAKDRKDALAKYREAANLYEEGMATAPPDERDNLAELVRELRAKK